MLRLHIVQAQFGDSLILEFGQATRPGFVLVDGGPKGTYERHLRPTLEIIAERGGKLDLIVLSHVDADHVTGVLALIAELRAGAAGGGPFIEAKGIWHNAFGDSVARGSDIESRLEAVQALGTAGGRTLAHMGIALAGVKEGEQLRRAANAFGLPINQGFPDGLILVDTAPRQVELGQLSIKVVGPTQANLDALREEWLAWLEEHEDEFQGDDPFAMAMADRSIPNLSSIQLLIKDGDKTMLLTGDGRGDHLLQGLAQTSLLNDGGLHVDVLKVPHHGSDRNVTKTFFRKITANQYVISADGTYSNPDYATLTWIVETAAEARRSIELVLTNDTPSTMKLAREYPPRDFGYSTRVLSSGQHALMLEVPP